MKVRANRLVIFTLCTALLCSQILPVQADARTLRQAALGASLNDAFATALGANLNAALAGSPFALPAGLPATASASSTTATAATFVPGPESKPLVVARVQSTYTPGGLIDNTLIITYTAINRMPLDRLSGATIDLKLAPGVTLVSGPAYLELPDGTLSFALGEITPADGASVAIVVRTPGTVGQIDAGARASASLANQRVTAQTAPARLVSDAFSAHLGQQPEFMFNDVDLLEVAGLVEQDAARAFALVRDATHWEAYLGSLRGARGTWWSEAGNALDRASLLLGVLRTIGVPSRYVRGSLPLARQHELIGQMFGDTVSQIGSVSAENQYDPYTDAKLLAAAADHWWVEADLGSGWQALDPNFKPAAIGNVFGTSSTVVASIAAQDRHWTKIALTVEHLPALTGPAGKLETFKAFELELPTAQIAGVPTVIGHFVRSTFDGGAVFYNIRHYYTPFIAIGGIRPDATIYRGDEYLEQITNFPLASQRVTAASFDVTIYGPGVPTQTYQDEIVDRIGKLARREGGTVNSAGLSNTGPIVQDKQSISLFVTPTWVPEHAVARAAGRMQQQMEKAQAAGEALRQALPSGNATNEAEEALVGALDGEIATLSLEIAVANGFSAMRDADQAMRQYAEIGRVQARYVAPRLLASALDVSYTETPTTALKARLNLMRRDLELTPYPGQNPEVVYGVRMAQGIRSMTSEHMTLATLADPAWEAGPVKSVLGVMEAATQQEIGYTLITPDKPWAVQELAVSDDAKARMLSSLEQGFAVMTPQAAPMIDGQPYTAWFEINLETGAVTDQDEYGNRTAIITYAKLQRGWQQKKCSGEKCEDVDARYALLGFIAGFTVRLLTRVVSTIGFVNLYVSGSPVIALIQSACIAYHEAAQQSGQVGSLPGQAKSSGCSIKQVLDFFDAVLWLAINMFVRFARDVHNCGVPKNPLTINSEFWSGITLLEVKFWSSKCVEFVAKMATLGITTPAEFMSKLFDANSVDPFKITAMLLPDLVEGVTGSEAVAFLSSGALSADLASIKLRIGGFDHGASVAAALISNRLSKDPDLPPEVGFNTAAPADRPVEATRTITPATTLGSSLSSAFSAAHAHLHSPGVITVTDGALAINGGEVRASGARLLDANGAQLYSGDLTAQLSAQGARLTLVGQAILSGASDASLWQQDGQLAGQATLTDAHRLTLHSSAPMTLHLGAGAVVNGTRWDQPMQVVFSSAEGRRVERMAWLNSSAVAWASSNATVHLSTIAGSLGGASNAVVSALGFAGNGQATTSGAGALNLTVAGSTATLLSAAPTWSMSGTRQLLAPNLSANRSLSLTLSAMLDEQRVNYFFEAADTAGQLTVERLPDQMSDDSLSGKLFLREDDYRAALVANTQVSLSARVPALEVSVAPDELNKPIWGEFPYYGVMGLLYNATITYTAATSGVFDLALSGFPAGWASLSREQIALEKGQTVGVGIVISPPLGAMPLPGTTIPFTLTVTQVGGGSLSAVGSAEWRAPETGLPGVMFDPNVRTEVAPTETVVAGLYVFNGGAISDTFTISAATNVPTAVSAIPDLPISVSVGVDDVTRVPVTVTFDAEPGQLIAIAGIAGPYRLYTRTAMTHQRFAIVPVEDIPLYERAYALRGPGCNARLAHATYELAQHTSAYRLNKVGIAEVEAAKARLAGVLPCYETLGEFTATQTVSTALTLVPTNTQELADALDLLHEQVKPVLDYQVALQVQPALTVARVGQPVSVPVVLEHTGNLTGAFTLLVTDTVSGLATVTTTLGPGQRFTHTVSFTPSAAGTFFITATAQTPAPQARAAAAGTVLAYERWTDILTVKGSPDFVETGSSSAALSADVVNYTPLPQPVTIYLTMTAPNGSVYYTAQVTHTAPKGVSNVPLGTAHFMNAAAGVYRLEARLVEEDRTALGGVSAGAGMRVTTRSSPLIVPPGDVTATTWITTERTVYGSGGMFEVGVPISGGVDLTITLNAALHSGSTPSAGVAVTVPAGIYDAIYITGAVRWHDGGQWYGQVDIYDTSNDKYYMLGHGVNTALGSFDPFVGGLPTMEAAGAYHTGRFIRLRITDTAVLRLYIYDTALTGSSANTGTITVRLVQVGGPDNTLKRRMEAAMHHATPRHALDAIQWDRWTGASTDAYGLGRWFQVNHNCNGCHIQAQGIAGLSALNTKLKPSPVDERMTEWLSTRIRGWQVVPTGTVGGHWEGYHIMSSLAMWAWAEQLRMETNLGRAPSPTVTNAMTRALGWALPYYRSWNVWQTDRPREFPWQTVPNQCYSYFDFSPMTTYFIMTALRQAYDLTGNISYLSQLTNAAITLATRVNWRGTCSGERYPHRTALVLLGLQEAVDVMTDTAQIQIVREALAAFENDLRVTQQLTPTTTANDGGWRRENMTSGPSDPYITAMALYALARQGVRSTDINLVRASEFLLERQDSWWNTNISAWVYTSPRTGRWWSYSASTSVAPTTWVDFALPLVYEAIGSYSLDVLHDT
ncbi:MAG: transglutaminase domain-containing protein, partial [Anaerolineae bacterium]